MDMACELGRRKDLRERVLFTIDGVNAKDFDDAVGIEKLQDGTFLLTVAIADVAHAVRPGTALDREARERSFSVYFPEIAIPMLPEALSNGAMSLKPGLDRLAMAVEIVIGPRGGSYPPGFSRPSSDRRPGSPTRRWGRSSKAHRMQKGIPRSLPQA